MNLIVVGENNASYQLVILSIKLNVKMSVHKRERLI
jgi:hypothetical protein